MLLLCIDEETMRRLKNLPPPKKVVKIVEVKVPEIEPVVEVVQEVVNKKRRRK